MEEVTAVQGAVIMMETICMIEKKKVSNCIIYSKFDLVLKINYNLLEQTYLL